MQKLFIKQARDMLQNGGTFKRWLYRRQKPGLIAKFLNRMMANNASKEAMDNGLVALEVIGRKSGKVISFPLVMVRVDEQRYLASMLGESQWVCNVRAAGGKAVLRSGGGTAPGTIDGVVYMRPEYLGTHLIVQPEIIVQGLALAAWVGWWLGMRRLKLVQNSGSERAVA